MPNGKTPAAYMETRIKEMDVIMMDNGLIESN
jgi:hypothetical protein